MNITILPAFSGLIDSIISTVLRIILTPIMELVAFLLETILGPILETILVPVMDFAVELVLKTMSSVFYTMLKALLTILETIEKSFQIFAGVSPVTYNGKQTDLLNIFVIDNSDLTRAFWLLTFLCLLLCFIFTIYGVARSTLDFDFENKRPIGKVLGAAGKTCLTFLIVPLFVVFTIMLTSVVMKEVYRVTNMANLSVSDTVFQISAMSANIDAADNLSSSQTFVKGTRAQFNNGGWKNVDAVKGKFDLSKIDYVLGFGLTIFLIFILATVSFVFVQRIFEIMLLYLAAPFFVSSMPLDDGAKYSGWRDMFIAKMIAGMGTLVMMNLYLMAVTVVMGSDIVLDPRTLSGGVMGSEYLTYDYLIKIVFVAGGALAVKQGASLITGLVNYQAGMQEQMTMAQTGAMVRRAGGFAMGAAYGVAKGVGKVGLAPAKGAVWGAKAGAGYALTNKRLHGDDNSKMTRALRAGHDAKGTVKDVASGVKSVAHGDFGGAFKKGGEDTYMSKRVSAFQNRDFDSFFKVKDDKLREEKEAPIREARAKEDELNRAFITDMRLKAEAENAAKEPAPETTLQAALNVHGHFSDGIDLGPDDHESDPVEDFMKTTDATKAEGAAAWAADSAGADSADGQGAFTGGTPGGFSAIQDARISDDDDDSFSGGSPQPPFGGGGGGSTSSGQSSGTEADIAPKLSGGSSEANGGTAQKPSSGTGGSTPPRQPNGTSGTSGGTKPKPSGGASGTSGGTKPKPRPPRRPSGGGQKF